MELVQPRTRELRIPNSIEVLKPIVLSRRIIALVGLPGAGKTESLKLLGKKSNLVACDVDDVRFQVQGGKVHDAVSEESEAAIMPTMHKMNFSNAESELSRGNPVGIACTSRTKESRGLLEVFAKKNNAQLNWIVFTAPRDVIEERLYTRSSRSNVNTIERWDTIASTSDPYEDITSNVLVVDTTRSLKQTIPDILNYLEETDVLTKAQDFLTEDKAAD